MEIICNLCASSGYLELRSISQHTNIIVCWNFTSKAIHFTGCLTLQMVHFSLLRQPASYLMLVLQRFDDF